MYSEIHQFKKLGLKKAQVARNLNLDVKTVSKYWDATPEQFQDIKQVGKKRSRKLKDYRDVILKWLKDQPDMSTAQILDWLKEHYADFSVRERTLRRYVSELRIKYDLPKPVSTRQYQAVEELPPGYQLQLDFGQKRVQNLNGGYTMLYAMGAVLSHSRYKYGQWTDKPLTTARFVQLLIHCFEYLGGVVEELVIDQDKLVAVSENYGDIIFTYEFEKFKQLMGFKVYLCRKNDPESKGKIEAVVKHMKNNFAANRKFADIRSWNQSFYDWLKRTGNYNVHGTTKKVPAEVFLMEQKYLNPVPSLNHPEEIVTVQVRKDNTVLYLGNRYTVPIGTYSPKRELKRKIDQDQLCFYDLKTGELVAEHRLSNAKGELIRNSNHLRDHRKKIEELFQLTLFQLGGSIQAETFLTEIRKLKPRYVRDQFKLIQQLIDSHGQKLVLEAISYCLERCLYSAVDCRDVALWLSEQADDEPQLPVSGYLSDWLQVKAEKRDPAAAYANLSGGEA